MAQNLFKIVRDFLRSEEEIEEREADDVRSEEDEFDRSFRRVAREEPEEEPVRRPRSATLDEIVEAVGAEEGEVEDVKEAMKANEEQIVHIPHEDPAQVRYGLAEHAQHFPSYQPGLNPNF